MARREGSPCGITKTRKKTAATFVVDADGTRWVMPGDLASVLDDGSIQLLGRGAATINSGGEKIFPQEVEEASEAHPSVYDASLWEYPTISTVSKSRL